MFSIYEVYDLNTKGIDDLSNAFLKFCETNKIDKKDTITLRLNIENALTIWKNTLGEDNKVVLSISKKHFIPYVCITCRDEKSVNPFKDNIDQYTKSIMRLLAVIPEYYYEAELNTITFKLDKYETNFLLRVAIIVAQALIVGLVGKFALPQDIIDALLNNVLDPIYSKFLSVLSCFANPLIFLSIAWGIYGIGDIATLNKYGKKLIKAFLMMAIGPAIISICCFPIFNLSLAKGPFDSYQIGQILSFFLDAFPNTVLDPFILGNTLQIIVLGGIFGITILFLGKKVEIVSKVLEECNNIANTLMTYMGKLLPLLITMVLIDLVWTDQLLQASDTWFLLVMSIVITILVTVMLLFYTSIKLKIRPKDVVKKVIKPVIVAASTTSTVAALSELIDSCKNKFGVDEHFTEFGVPLASVLQKMTIVIEYALCVLYVASESGISVTTSWLIIGTIISVVTAFAAPPIPGGATVAFAVLFSQLGLPIEYIGIVLAVDIINDYITTPISVFCIPMIIADVAKNFNLVNDEILHKK